jgi:hypothetical protein
MRVFRSRVFLGNGETSQKAVKALHQRLGDGLVDLGFLQQSHKGEANLDAEIALEEVVRDIASALLGREVAIREVQPESDDSNVIEAYLRRQ